MFKPLFIFAIVVAMLSGIATAADFGGLPPGFETQTWKIAKSANFEIGTLDAKSTADINQKTEALKTWIYRRWGLKDAPFKHTCQIIAVPTAEKYKLWFQRPFDLPKFVNAKDLDGVDREVYFARFATEGSYLTDVLPNYITRICLMNYEKTYNVKFGVWAYEGMSGLNTDTDTIRKTLLVLNPKVNNYSSRELFELQSPEAVTPELKAKCTLMCLLLRKQPNADVNFVRFLEVYSTTSNPDQALNVFGFKSVSDFDEVFNRFARDFLDGLKNNKVPNMSLTWFLPQPVEK